jgi:hypothetical protein
MNAVHGLHHLKANPHINKARAQSWLGRRNLASASWLVDELPQAPQPVRQSGMPSNPGAATLVEELDLLEEQERVWLMEEEEFVLDDGDVVDVNGSATTEWLKSTKWREQFHNRPVRLISATKYMPYTKDITEHQLGDLNGVPLVITADIEVKIRHIMDAVDQVAEWCEESQRDVSYTVRCWLRSPHHEVTSKTPFHMPQAKHTIVRYWRAWKSFLCFCFRVWSLEPGIQDSVYGVKFSDQQWDMMAIIHDHIHEHPDELADDKAIASGESGDDSGSEYHPDDEDGRPRTSASQRQILAEMVLGLSVSFWRQREKSSSVYTLPLMYYSGVLGIHPQTYTFRSAYHYTPLLAPLVWLGRIMLLEYALPVQRFYYLKWAHRDDYSDQNERFTSIRKRYIAVGGCHALSALQEVLFVGRSMASEEGPRAKLLWHGPDVVQYSDAKVDLADFRVMVRSIVQECQELLPKLLFDWTPPVPELRGLVDELVDAKPGASFLTKNHLGFEIRPILQRALQRGALKDRKGDWDLQAVKDYHRCYERFQAILLTAMHYTGGMPSRGAEMTTLRISNTTAAMRNVYVLNGEMVVIIEYTKTRTLTNQTFYIAKFYPPLVGQLIFYYLVYIQRFANYIHRNCLKSTTASAQRHSPYMFARLGGNTVTLQSKHMSDEITRQTKCYLGGARLGIQGYRQVVNGITRRHLVTMVRAVKPYDKLDEANAPLIPWAQQSGHTIRTFLQHYGNNIAFPTRLQPELLARYENVSKVWHEWLDLEQTKPAPQLDPTILEPPEPTDELLEAFDAAIRAASAGDASSKCVLPPDCYVSGEESNSEDAELRWKRPRPRSSTESPLRRTLRRAPWLRAPQQQMPTPPVPSRQPPPPSSPPPLPAIQRPVTSPPRTPTPTPRTLPLHTPHMPRTTSARPDSTTPLKIRSTISIRSTSTVFYTPTQPEPHDTPAPAPAPVPWSGYLGATEHDLFENPWQ